MAGLTVDATPTASLMWQPGGQKLYYKSFTGAAAVGDATTIQAAGGAGTRHIVYGITLDADTAETVAIKSGTTTLLTIRFLVADTMPLRFTFPLECGDNEALVLDKGTTATITGRIWYAVAAKSGSRLEV